MRCRAAARCDRAASARPFVADVEDRVIEFFSYRAEGRALRDSSIGEQDVDFALLLFDLSEEPTKIFELRHVSLNGGNIFSNLLDRRVQLRLATSGDKERTFIYKSLRRGKADAAVATGDKRNLSLKLTQVFLVSCQD